jgi:hypothetical protein
MMGQPQSRNTSRRRSLVGLPTLVAALLIAAPLATLIATSPASATPNSIALKVLLVGNGVSDPTTAAWEAALSNEGVSYTEVDANTSETPWTLSLPTLSSGSTGDFDAVVIADDRADFAAGQLSALDAYEIAFGVRELDGYAYPSPTLGVAEVSAGLLDGTSAQLTSAGLAALPGLAGPLAFDTGTYGYSSTVISGAPFTPWIENSAGDVLGGVYQQPSGISQAALFFNYGALQSQWLVLGHALIDWVTGGNHLGLFRNYAEVDIDDTFTPDDAWITATHSTDYSDADALRMLPTDVVYAAQWSQTNHFRLDQLFNGAGSTNYQAENGGTDPLLAQFQATDPGSSQTYAADFGWISHTYDTPYLDVGCATQNYIEAELNENTSWAAAAPGTTAGTGGLGLTRSTVPTVALGAENPQVFVPGNHSGLADLVPGNPATVDPPDLDSETATSGVGSLPAAIYEYAVTDDFSSGGGQSSAYVTGAVSLPSKGSIALTWQAICHASDYLVYREVAGSNQWSLIGTVSSPSSATLPDASSGDPVSTSDVTGGGELEQSFTDTGIPGTAEPSGWAPPTVENATETAWEQNPYFVPALEAVGITDVGADASKPYPDPPDDQFGIGATYAGSEYPAGATFVDGTAQVVPRHPINIYYNASTQAQEVDEYNTLYLSTADGGSCVDSSTTTCLTTPATFADIVNQVVSGMFQNMTENDPEPSYVHQTNIMGAPPAGPPTTGTPPSTPDTTGDGLLYSVLNPLLAEYNTYFNSTEPYEQLTEAAIGNTLADQSAWASALSGDTTSAVDTDGSLTITNNGSSTLSVPLTVPSGTTLGGSTFGQSYAGEMSGWITLSAGASAILYEPTAATITSATSATATVGTPFSFTVSTAGYPAASLSKLGTLPGGITFTDNNDGTATLAGTPAAGSGGVYGLSISATNGVGSPATHSFTLTVDEAPVITSAIGATATVGEDFSFSVTTADYPVAALSELGALPPGITFTDNADGTASFAGTPATGSGADYSITVSATNGIGTDATQSFTLAVDEAATITSATSATATVGTPFSFTVTTGGSPTAALSESGALAPGITFTDNNDGTATFAGTPTAGGSFEPTITASTSVGIAKQLFTLTVDDAAAITSGASATATVGTAFAFSVTTSGYPVATVSETGALPAGITFTANSDGTASLAGTPASQAGGVYSFTISATNGLGDPATQSFSLTLCRVPAFTSAASATATVGKPFRFALTASGSPAPAIAWSGRVPQGLKFTSGNGKASFSGTPSAPGSFKVTLSAHNSAGTAKQAFTLIVRKPPAITSAAKATVKVGKAFRFVFTASGSPTPTITESGKLPRGLKFATGSGKAILSGTPAASGSFKLTITARNSAGTVRQTFVLKVVA